MSEGILVPAARNLAHNPRPASTTHFGGTAGSTRTFVTDRSYSGTGSVLVQLLADAGQNAYWLAAPAADADFLAITPGATIRAMAHFSGVIPVGEWKTRLVVRYTDATFQITEVNPVDVNNIDFKRVIFPDLVTNPAKQVDYIYTDFTRVSGAAGTATSFYWGGFDVRVNQPLDAFIHGAAGANYAWEGTANASPSTRAAYTVGPFRGSGGQIYPSVRLFVVNRQNQVKREITKHFIDGSVNYDLDAEQWKGSCTLVLGDPGLVTPLADEYVRIQLRVERADGTFEDKSIGMFMVDPPDERWSAGYDQWTYQGKDMLGLLATWLLRGPAASANVAASGYVLGSGRPYRAAIEDILFNHVGLAREQVALPIGDTLALGNIGFENGTTVLAAITALLQGAGWQKPWVTPEGIITSAPAGLNPAQVEPSLVLATGENSQVRWPFEVDPEISKVGNRVRVFTAKNVSTPVYQYFDPVPPTYKKKKRKKKKDKLKLVDPGDPGGNRIVAYEPVPNPVESTRANMDPAHPLSIPRLGRVLDLPDVNVPLVADEAAATALADQALRDASLIPIRVRLTTEVMVRGLHEVYDLDLKDAFGNPIASGQGRYWCRGWTLQLGMPWEMTHNLTRVVEYATVSWDTGL